MIIEFAGQRAELTPEGGIFFPASGLLAVADLHFEKGSFFERLSTFLPPYDSLETLRKLEGLLVRRRPKVFIAAGDSFHDLRALERMRSADAEQLCRLIQSVERWIWLTGNHDPSLTVQIPGEWLHEHQHQDIVFRHRTQDKAHHEITGHYHPKIRFGVRGHRLSAPCFVRFADRMILPSFGRFTGGLDINSDAFTALTEGAEREVYALYDDRVFAI